MRRYALIIMFSSCWCWRGSRGGVDRFDYEARVSTKDRRAWFVERTCLGLAGQSGAVIF